MLIYHDTIRKKSPYTSPRRWLILAKTSRWISGNPSEWVGSNTAASPNRGKSHSSRREETPVKENDNMKPGCRGGMTGHKNYTLNTSSEGMAGCLVHFFQGP